MKAYFHTLTGGMDAYDNIQKDFGAFGEANRKKREAENKARKALIDKHRALYTSARKSYLDNKTAKPGVSFEGMDAIHQAYSDELDWFLANVSPEEIIEDKLPINLESAKQEKEILAKNKALVGWGFPDVVIPMKDFVSEHRDLLKTLKSKSPIALNKEYKDQKAELDAKLEGSGIAEDKRYLNAKSPWTLAHMEMKILQGFYNNPNVPPSMKTKLKTAMMIKPTLKPKSKKKLYGLLKGGLAGVSKASGFIQRLMAENKKKHGNYKNPTWELHPESTMRKAVKFDYKKLATTDQGGLKREGNPYGASPFITQHFQNQRPLEEKDGESEAQKRARLAWNTRRLLRVAENRGAPEEIHEDLQNHFGNIQPDGLFVDAEPAERAVRATRPNPVLKAGWEDEMKDALSKPDLISHLQEYIKEYKKSHSIDEKANKIFRYVIEHPRAKLAEVIADLKKRGETKGLANGTISPILKTMRELLKTGVESFIDKRKKAEDLDKRSGKMKEVLKKNIPLKKLRKEAKEKLFELQYEKEEREEEKRIAEEKAERIKEIEQERLDVIERKKQKIIDDKKEAEEAQALQEKEFKDSRSIAKKTLKANLPPKEQMDKWKQTWAKFKGRRLDTWEKEYWFGEVLRSWNAGYFPGKSDTDVAEETMSEPKLKYENIPGEFHTSPKTPKKRLTAKSQADFDAYGVWMKSHNEKYNLNKKNIKEMAVEFVKWLFNKALPLYDYKLLTDIPEDVKGEPFKRYMVLSNPKFSFAWGLKDDETIAKAMIEPQQSARTGFSFDDVYKIDHTSDGDEWSKLSFDDIHGKNTPRGQKRQGLVMLGNNPDGDDVSTRHIDWAMPQGLAQIIRPLWEELMEYTEEEVPKKKGGSRRGQTGSSKPQIAVGEYVMCGV